MNTDKDRGVARKSQNDEPPIVTETRMYSYAIDSAFNAVRNCVFFFDVEADLGFGKNRGRLEQRAKLLVNIAQGEEEGLVNPGQPLLNSGNSLGQ